MAVQRADTAGQIKRKAKRGNVDFSILITTLILVLFGIVMVYSASFYYAEVKFNDGQYYVKKQLLGAALGMAAMIFLMYFDYRKLQRYAKLSIIVSIVLLAVVFIDGVGVTLNEASRWIELFGFRFSRRR